MGTSNDHDSAPDNPPKNILVVEDNRENLRVLDEMLTNHGYLVRPASSGALALRSIKSNLPDIILLDIKMPDMDGYEVCEILRKDEQIRDIPVIFISGMRDAQDKVHAFEVGGMDYITKPFLPEETLARIKIHLELAETKKKLKKLNAELEERVREKTEQLKEREKKLRQAQKMEAIGTLAGGIAHDFNNILSIIFGYHDLALIDIECQEKLQQHLTQIRKGAGRAKELVNQILTFSRMKEKEKQPLNPALVIKEALKLLRSSIPTTIVIRENIISNEILLADTTQIHQIIMNLCTNAYHSMHETGGTLTVSLQDIEITEGDTAISGLCISPGKYIRLEVSDTGHGMDKKTKAKIFEPYFTTKEIGEGTGLGLAVVHGIVRGHNGYIIVESELEKGTGVYVYFPIFKGVSAELKKGDNGPVTGGSERIMFVDDEEKICHIANETLTRYGYQVTVFQNGNQAALEFEKRPEQFDLIITDTTMPRMSGIDLSQHIFNLSPHIPVILCSGYSDLANREELNSMGIHFIQKPIVMSELVRRVREVLDKV